jgi:hypothetical protein
MTTTLRKWCQLCRDRRTQSRSGQGWGSGRINPLGPTPGELALSRDCRRFLKVLDVLGRDRIAADTPVAAFDFVDRDPRDSTQRLSLDAHHCLGELRDHLFLLAAIEDSFDYLDLDKWHDALLFLRRFGR